MAQSSGWGGPQGPYGWGGSGGWGAPLPPPPPKPGVIPLVPLTVGQVLGGALAAFGRYAKQLIGVVLSVYGAALVLGGAAVAAALFSLRDHLHRLLHLDGASAATTDVRPVVIWGICVLVLGAVVLLVAQAVVQAACAVLVQQGVLGRRVTYRSVLRTAFARLGPVLGSLTLSALAVAIPLLLAGVAALLLTLLAGPLRPVTAIPVVYVAILAVSPLTTWLWLRMSLAPTVAVVEPYGPLAALRRSRDLVRGNWWRIFGITLVASLCAGFAADIIMVLIELLGFLGVGGALLSDSSSPSFGAVSLVAVPVMLAMLFCEFVVLTFPQLVVSLIYVDQRMRKENLAAGLIAAAERGA